MLAEFKGMVKLLHEAGIEVILDVVYNHTAEEGIGGPRTSFRGIDNATYYRQDEHGAYIDVTGCGNTVDFGHDVPVRLVLDSLRYWANEVQIDGFRFDLAATLGRDADVEYTPDHPLLQGILARPAARGRQDDRRAVGCRNRRLADRQLPRRLVGVERPLPRPGAQLLAGRHRRGPAQRSAPDRHRRLRDATGRLLEHLLAGARAARLRQLRHRPRRLHAWPTSRRTT